MGALPRLVVLLAAVGFAGLGALAVGPDGWGTGVNHELVAVRLPRVLAALVAGWALGVAGATQQGVFRNPLADPGLTGVFGGAVLGLGLLLALAPEAAWERAWYLPAAAGLGSLAATSLLVALGRGRPIGGLILAGLGINALAGAGSMVVMGLSEEARSTLMLTGAGNWLGFVTLELIAAPIAVALLAGALALTLAGGLDRLALGEEAAWTAGTDGRGLAWRAALLTSLAAGAATCLCGPIAFVGLLAPHLGRAVAGAAHRRALPAAGLAGSLLLLLADTAGRCGWLGLTLPAGALVALAGAPAFLWLARRHG